MSKLKIKIKPLFVLYVFLCIYFGWFNTIFYYVIAVTLHEYGHYIVAKLKGYNFDFLQFNVCGGGLFGSNNFKKHDDILISLAGPLVNILLIIVFIALWWIFPTIYYFTYDFVICNIVVFAFNILPFYPLDGGRVVLALLGDKYGKMKILKIGRVVCFVLGIIFAILFILSLFWQFNLNLIFISFFFVLNGLTNDNSYYDEKIKCFIKNTSTPIEVKTFVVNNISNRYELLKYTSPHYYSVFEVRNEKNRYVVTEDDLLKL